VVGLTLECLGSAMVRASDFRSSGLLRVA